MVPEHSIQSPGSKTGKPFTIAANQQPVIGHIAQRKIIIPQRPHRSAAILPANGNGAAFISRRHVTPGTGRRLFQSDKVLSSSGGRSKDQKPESVGASVAQTGNRSL